MKSARRIVFVAVLIFQIVPVLHGQFGPQESQGSGPKLATPTAFPVPGTFPTTESVTLMDADPGARIHYTWDGSAPNSKSPVYDPSQLLFIGGVYEGDHGLKTGYTLRAIAIPDALWMQWAQAPLDGYLSTVKTSRANFRDKVKYIMTGHNDHPLQGEAYLDNLEDALQSLMDKGDAVLTPSYRPAGALQVTRGDRMHDPSWGAVNVNKEHCLPAPVDRIAGLTRLAITGAVLNPAFKPDVKTYTATIAANVATIDVIVEPTSTRSSAITVNGEAVKSGVRHEIRRMGDLQKIQIHVASPDGTQVADYTLTIQ